MTLKVGDQAPGFSLPTDSGEVVSLKDFAGKKVALYFYPKDDTPGCTKEACSFRDSNSELRSAGIVVLGISKDSVASHQKFSRKYSLPFPLLSDKEKTVANAYGTWGPKVFMGRSVIGMRRMTFLIDESGRIARIWEKVKPEGHAREVLEAASAGAM